jgi:tetratricopeptide (TPR) repeat protein
MRTHRLFVRSLPIPAAHVFFAASTAALVALGSGCARQEADPRAPAPAAAEAKPTAPADGGKIPITTSSQEARSEFLQGRELVDKLLITDSTAHFRKAVELDPNFAAAELALSAAVPTGKEFFEHIDRAASLADKVSNGERLQILAAQAAAQGNPTKQREYLEQLVAAYPGDDRAHLALANFLFGLQDYPNAIEHYKKATEINPQLSTAFNLLGYAYRQAGRYDDSEKAFQSYIKLIPNDPNPYDSYAELLLKMGRYDDAIAQYRKALEIQPNFVNAHQGIAMAQLYSGKPKDASAELDAFAKKARTDAEQRTAMFARTIVYLDQGDAAKALAELDKQYALGEKTNDAPGMIGDRQLRGLILVETGRPDAAKVEYEKALEVAEKSSLSDQVKSNVRRTHHYNMARVAVAKKDLAGAKREADEFRKAAADSKNQFVIQNSHELDGIIALAEKDWDRAIAELQQANPQNPEDLYRIGVAYRAKGDAAKAQEYFTKAANFNSLPNILYAIVRTKAKSGEKA